jgi:hypothetical protein
MWVSLTCVGRVSSQPNVFGDWADIQAVMESASIEKRLMIPKRLRNVEATTESGFDLATIPANHFQTRKPYGFFARSALSRSLSSFGSSR